jgi:hypothetical protein
LLENAWQQLTIDSLQEWQCTLMLMLTFTATIMLTPSIVLHPHSIKDSLLHDGVHRQSAIHSFPTFLHVCIQLS